jgi:hypothetical protein
MNALNDHQLKPTAENARPSSRTLLETWGRPHAIRTRLDIAATLVFIWALH